MSAVKTLERFVCLAAAIVLYEPLLASDTRSLLMMITALRSPRTGIIVDGSRARVGSYAGAGTHFNYRRGFKSNSPYASGFAYGEQVTAEGPLKESIDVLVSDVRPATTNPFALRPLCL